MAKCYNGFTAENLTKTEDIITTWLSNWIDVNGGWVRKTTCDRTSWYYSALSNLHYNYYSAWRFVTKEDEHDLQSEDHPDLWNSKAPKTNAACNERKKVRMEGDIAILTQLTVSEDDLEDDCFEVETTASDVDDNTKRKKRKKRLTPFELSEIIVEKGIKTRAELLAFANMQKLEGKSDIAEFLANRGPRCCRDSKYSMGNEERATKTGEIEENPP